jgi:hypothetical protein
MKKANMRTVHLIHGYNYWELGSIRPASGLREMQLAVEGMNQEIPLSGILLDYHRTPGVDSSDANLVIKGVPVFQALTNGDVPPDAMLEEILRNAPEVGDPPFMHIFLVNWTYGPWDIARIAKSLPESFVVVDAETLARLFTDYQRLQ